MSKILFAGALLAAIIATPAVATTDAAKSADVNATPTQQPAQDMNVSAMPATADAKDAKKDVKDGSKDKKAS